MVEEVVVTEQNVMGGRDLDGMRGAESYKLSLTREKRQKMAWSTDQAFAAAYLRAH